MKKKRMKKGRGYKKKTKQTKTLKKRHQYKKTVLLKKTRLITRPVKNKDDNTDADDADEAINKDGNNLNAIKQDEQRFNVKRCWRLIAGMSREGKDGGDAAAAADDEKDMVMGY